MDSHQQQFCLKWNSFGSNLATAFSNLFKSESLTDVTLFCEGVTFKAHRLILAACSKHFQELFEGMPPSPAGLIVILDGTSAHNMTALLEFMYRGEVHVGQESLSSFLKAAECLQVKGLSIEHEKLAVAQRHAAAEGNNNNNKDNNKDNNSSSNSNGNNNGTGPTGSSSPSSADQPQSQQQTPQQQQPSSSSNAAAHSSSGISSTSSNNGNGNCSNGNGNGSNNGSLPASQQSTSSTISSASSSAASHNGSAESCATAAELLLQTSGGAGLGHQEPLLAGGPLNGPVALDRGIKRRRTPTPAPPSPHAPTYSLPNVYSSATHYYDSPQKRLMRSPSDVDSLGRGSVLRDGAAFRPASAPHPLLLENHLYQFGGHPNAPDTPTHPHTAPHTPTELEREVIKREHSEEREHNGETKEGVAEDLRIKQDPALSDRERMEKLAERLSSESYSRSSFDSGNYVNSSEHIERQQREQQQQHQREQQLHREHQHREQLHREQQQQHREHREQQQQLNANNVGPMGLGMAVMPPVHPPTPDLSPAPAAPASWNSKLNKAGTVTTPDGKKLKCPFCERLYGYETNLRAHIRQRHQGIRVPCPFCSRTFTRNNTVRRHIAREHKPELGVKALQQANHPVQDAVPQ